MQIAQKVMAAAILAALPVLPAWAQGSDIEELKAQMKAMSARLEALENENKALNKALGSEYLRDSDPEIASRVKVLETQTTELREKKGILEALSGVAVHGSLTTVGQSAQAAGMQSGHKGSELNWRGDVTIEAPAGVSGTTTGKVFAHLRVGQGEGLTSKMKSTYTNNINTTAFRLGGNSDASDSTALVAEAYYQLDFALPEPGQESAEARRRFQMTLGKMDPFVFFDQNSIADDESTRFLNNVFVHNAQLDSGGDIGMDSYGFSPGVRFAYRDESEGTQFWQISAAMLGSGNGATYNTSFSQPFVIAQAERGLKLFQGLDGTYRFYAWRNGRGNNFDGNIAPHTGWGVSIDQRLPGGVTLFSRYGHQMSGKVKFDRSFSAGAELSGNAWDRGADAIGLAAGWLKTSAAWKEASPTLEAYQASGAEKVYELFYRYQVNKAFVLSPDLQYLVNPAGNPDAKSAFAYGVRAKVSF
ncbi:carbohydrate porin [Uliginosibacterium gangwonense]|uniref:carbohydrate porin n=1 Tax=Uliginosibacterium gangwonense TaxID=392736 RepID=UPI00039D72C5|nr:carbohydrate porin [Uliginosibacterium gangwonense]